MSRRWTRSHGLQPRAALVVDARPACPGAGAYVDYGLVVESVNVSVFVVAASTRTRTGARSDALGWAFR